MAWLGCGSSAHIGAFAVWELPTGGMHMTTFEDGQQQHVSYPGQSPDLVESPTQLPHFVFEAFISNCAGGLTYYPPAFTYGPPWGVSFWAWKGDSGCALGAINRDIGGTCGSSDSSEHGPLVAPDALGVKPPSQGWEVVGAWLSSPGRGASDHGSERWAFGRLACPPIRPDFRTWRLCATFWARIIT